VADDTEAAWQPGFDCGNASVEFVHLSTVVAEEVMMVRLSGELVARRFAGQLNRHQPALLGHRLEVAIDSCDAEIVYAALCVGKDLVWREGTIRLDKSCTNRVLLPCISCRKRGARLHRDGPFRL